MIMANKTEQQVKQAEVGESRREGPRLKKLQHADVIRFVKEAFKDEELHMGEKLYAMSGNGCEMAAAFEIQNHSLDFLGTPIRVWFGLTHGTDGRRGGRSYAGLTWDGYPAVFSRYPAWRHNASNDFPQKIRRTVANAAYAMNDYPHKLGELMGRKVGPIEYESLCIRAAEAEIIAWKKLGVMRKSKIKLDRRVLPDTALSAVFAFGLAMDKSLWQNPRTDSMRRMFAFYKSVLGSVVR